MTARVFSDVTDTCKREIYRRENKRGERKRDSAQ